MRSQICVCCIKAHHTYILYVSPHTVHHLECILAGIISTNDIYSIIKLQHVSGNVYRKMIIIKIIISEKLIILIIVFVGSHILAVGGYLKPECIAEWEVNFLFEFDTIFGLLLLLLFWNWNKFMTKAYYYYYQIAIICNVLLHSKLRNWNKT